MSMTLREMRDLEYEELQKRREKEREEIKQSLEEALNAESIELLSIDSSSDGYKVVVAFTLDGFRQEDGFYWDLDESREDFTNKVKKYIDYIKELREQYPEYCKQNDYIQTNRDFYKKITLTHMGYKRTYELKLKLADYLKLPNTTSCSVGGGDYEIGRTPQRVDEFNKNIDIAIDALLDCIAELKQRKYKD
ncbi:hypothetical protein B4065_3328 [Caldibacillus thermoamylovorans]|uniref:hypothetical protein n=1 Tax=Caldibacillus thermoamylovorans TaxID=35841 RepID=UPI0005A489DD|nr:hypothetical protein [Caldibacillus thermoamylovorans]KIO62108.1 hypothetical protein B4065_3328 [Caldibacillus thermoamylovorans]